MKRNNKRITNIIIIFIIFFISLGYAYLNSNLSITGATSVAGNTWDIHFENVVESSDNTITATIAPVANPQDKVTDLTYSIRFDKPGDVYEFNVDVVNAGTIDAMIESFTSKIKIGDGELQEVSAITIPSYLDYYVTYEDGVKIKKNQLLNAAGRETITVHVEFKEDITEADLEEAADETILLDVDIEYIQATDEGEEKPIRLNCTYEGDLVNNAAYTNGQYFYQYNSSTDGWSVSLINRNSTDPVTTPLCSTINGKPINNMNGMFASSKTTSIDTSSFDTSHVTDMSGMFNGVKMEEIDLSSFDTRNVTNMAGMFVGCSELKELDLSSFDTSKVTNMSWLLNGASKIEKINFSNWDFNAVDGNFASNLGITSSIKELDFSRATFGENMNDYFSDLNDLENINFSNANTSRVTTMRGLFQNKIKISDLNLSSFDTSNVTNMNGIFENMTNLERLNLSGWDFSKVNQTFHTIVNHSTLKELDVSNVVFGSDLSSAFDSYYLANLEYLNLSGVDTSKTTKMNHTFKGIELFSIDVSDFDVQNVTEMYAMFENSKIERLDLSNWNTESITNMANLCTRCDNLKYINLNGLGSDNLSSIFDMFYSSTNIEEIHMKNFNFGEVSSLGSTQGPFYNKSKLKTVDLSGAKMPNITDLNMTFEGDSLLETLDLSNIYAPKKIIISYSMFWNNSSLKEIDLSVFDFSQLSSGSSMFSNVPATTVYVKDQASINKLNELSSKPDTMTFVVKP